MQQEIRLQKAMADMGIASRRKCEDLIREGEVKVNGQTVTELGTKVIQGKDHIEVEGKKYAIKAITQTRVYAFHKPKNCVTTLSDPQGRLTVAQFFPPNEKRLFPVGRLDYDAEGLLLLTNDGDFANKIMHPRHKIWKTYFVKVKGQMAAHELQPLRNGFRLEGRKLLPARVKILHKVNDKCWLEVGLQQGTNQQIKKMFMALGFPVLKIKRVKVGTVMLEDLPPGTLRLLTKEEVDQLKRLTE